jgi:hypothetical protein
MSNKILDDMRDVMRRRHYSIRTERSYCLWVKRFILHFNMKPRNDLSEGEKKIETYLTFLACDLFSRLPRSLRQDRPVSTP